MGMDGEIEIRKLRVLIVGGRAASVQILRTVFSMMGLRQIQAVPESARAIDALRSQRFSAIFCDALAEPYKNMPFPLAARRVPGILNPMTPLFVIYSEARKSQVEFARDSGATDVFARPISAATVERKLRAALATPRSFIVAPDFFGPDRRTQRPSKYYGEDRRVRAAKKTKFTLSDADSDGFEPV
jgi:CheY-like chemotaxis protein